MPYGRYSARTVPLPPEWRTEIRPRILARDGHACRWKISFDGTICGSSDRLEVDHIGDPSDHSDGNLRTLCHAHHKTRSSRQGAEAMHARRTPKARPASPHPGLL